MEESKKKPELIVIAGPNGSGKTTVTRQFLHHEWSDGVVYIIDATVSICAFWGKHTEASNVVSDLRARYRASKGNFFD